MTHIDPAVAADYFAAELDPAEERAVEEHVFECDACARLYEGAGALAAALRAFVPPVVSRAWLERERARGTPLRVTRLAAGDRITAEFVRELSYLVFVLTGDMPGARTLDVELVTPDGTAYEVLREVPFDPARGEVIIACQRHYFERYPQDVGFRLVSIDAGGQRAVVGEYWVSHLLPRAGDQRSRAASSSESSASDTVVLCRLPRMPPAWRRK